MRWRPVAEFDVHAVQLCTDWRRFRRAGIVVLAVVALLWLGPGLGDVKAVEPGGLSARPRLDFTVLRAPLRVAATARRVRVSVAASRRGSVRVGSRRYRVGRRVRALPVAVKPGVGTLKLRLVLRAGRARRARIVSIHRPPTVWQAVLDQVEPDGRVGPRMALQAFSVAIAPLPGVRLPHGPMGHVRSGTAAIKWLQANARRIKPAQRAAARRALADLKRRRRPALRARTRPSSVYARTLAAARVALALRFGFLPSSVEISARASDASGKDPEKPGGIALASTTLTWKSETELESCEILFTREGDQAMPREFLGAMVHEVVHCHAALFAGTATKDRALPPWLDEGAANWVADHLVTEMRGPGKLFSRLDLKEYLQTPGKPLFKRSYDGEGFFAELSWQGVDLWTTLPAMYAASDSEAAFAAAVGADERRIFGAWGASFFRKPAWGHDWHVDGPSMPPTRPPRTSLSIRADATVTARAKSYASVPVQVQQSADVATVSIGLGAVARTRDTRGREDVLDAGATRELAFCRLDPKDCVCPSGSQRSSPLPRTRRWVLALTNGGVSMRGMSIDDYCGCPADGARAALAGSCQRPIERACDLYQVQEVETILMGVMFDQGNTSSPVHCAYGIRGTGWPVLPPPSSRRPSLYLGIAYGHYSRLSIDEVHEIFVEQRDVIDAAVFNRGQPLAPIQLSGYDEAAQAATYPYVVARHGNTILGWDLLITADEGGRLGLQKIYDLAAAALARLPARSSRADAPPRAGGA